MEDRELIAEVWLRQALRTYPPQGAEFLAAEPDPFRNPAGHAFRQALRTLLEELYGGMDRARLTGALDSLMQIRAVESVGPSQALRFLFQLKDILRVHGAGTDWNLLNGRIDEMALLAFDLYMKYRERTYDARANEARRRVFVMERRLLPRDVPACRERGGH